MAMQDSINCKAVKMRDNKSDQWSIYVHLEMKLLSKDEHWQSPLCHQGVNIIIRASTDPLQRYLLATIKSYLKLFGKCTPRNQKVFEYLLRRSEFCLRIENMIRCDECNKNKDHQLVSDMPLQFACQSRTFESVNSHKCYSGEQSLKNPIFHRQSHQCHRLLERQSNPSYAETSSPISSYKHDRTSFHGLTERQVPSQVCHRPVQFPINQSRVHRKSIQRKIGCQMRPSETKYASVRSRIQGELIQGHCEVRDRRYSETIYNRDSFRDRHLSNRCSSSRDSRRDRRSLIPRSQSRRSSIRRSLIRRTSIRYTSIRRLPSQDSFRDRHSSSRCASSRDSYRDRRPSSRCSSSRDSYRDRRPSSRCSSSRDSCRDQRSSDRRSSVRRLNNRLPSRRLYSYRELTPRYCKIKDISDVLRQVSSCKYDRSLFHGLANSQSMDNSAHSQFQQLLIHRKFVLMESEIRVTPSMIELDKISQQPEEVYLQIAHQSTYGQVNLAFNSPFSKGLICGGVACQASHNAVQRILIQQRIVRRAIHSLFQQRQSNRQRVRRIGHSAIQQGLIQEREVCQTSNSPIHQMILKDQRSHNSVQQNKCENLVSDPQSYHRDVPRIQIQSVQHVLSIRKHGSVDSRTHRSIHNVDRILRSRNNVNYERLQIELEKLKEPQYLRKLVQRNDLCRDSNENITHPLNVNDASINNHRNQSVSARNLRLKQLDGLRKCLQWFVIETKKRLIPTQLTTNEYQEWFNRMELIVTCKSIKIGWTTYYVIRWVTLIQTTVLIQLQFGDLKIISTWCKVKTIRK